MGRLQCISQVDGFVQELRHRQRLAGNILAEGLAFQQLHHQERLVLVLANLMDGADIRMVDSGGGAGFALESFQRLRIAG
jgi:hypothetical protein